MIHSNFNHSI